MKNHNVIIAALLLFSGISFLTLAQQNGSKKKPAPAPKNAVMIKDVTKDTTAANHKTKLPPPKAK